MEYFRSPASRWIYDTAVAAVSGESLPPYVGKRCQIGVVKPASKVVTVSDVQFYIQAKLTEECVAKVNEEYGKLEDIEGAIVILTSFRFGSIPRLGSGTAAPADFAPDLCLIVHTMRLLGGVDNRMFGAPTAVSDEPAIRKQLSMLTLSQRRARAPFLLSLSSPLLDAEIIAIGTAGVPVSGERPKITFQTQHDGVTLFVAVPNDVSDLQRDRQRCLPYISSQQSGSDPAPQWESSQATPGFMLEPCSASADDGLSQLIGPTQYPWSNPSGGTVHERAPVIGVMHPVPIPSQDGEDEPLEPELQALAEQSRALQRTPYASNMLLLSRPPASPVGVPATYQLPSSNTSQPQASGSPSLPSSTHSKDSPGDESLQLKVECDVLLTRGDPTPVSRPHHSGLDPATPVSCPNPRDVHHEDHQQEPDEYDIGASQFEPTQPQYASGGEEEVEVNVEGQGVDGEETQLPVDAHQHESLGFEDLYNRESQSMSQLVVTQEEGQQPNAMLSQIASFAPPLLPVRTPSLPAQAASLSHDEEHVVNVNRPLQRPGDVNFDSQILPTPSQVEVDVPLPPAVLLTSSTFDESQALVVPLAQVEVTPPHADGAVTSSGSLNGPEPLLPTIASNQTQSQQHREDSGSGTDTDDEADGGKAPSADVVASGQFLVPDASSESQPSLPSQQSQRTGRRTQSPSASQLFGDEDPEAVPGAAPHRVVYVRKASHKRRFVGTLHAFLDQFSDAGRAAKK